ncbi:MAG: hypothetical protein ACLSHL_15810 [Alistipes communis]
MNSIATQYLGLELSGPVIMGSSGLTSTLRHIVEAEEAGAGAVVLKSVFEEQILHEASRLDRYSDYPEAGDYVRRYVSEACARAVSRSDSRGAGPLRDTRDRQYPLRSSGRMGLLCTVDRAGGGFGNRAEHIRPAYGCGPSSEQIERAYFDIAAQVREVVSVPLAVKLGAGFTNPLRIVARALCPGNSGCRAVQPLLSCRYEISIV